MKVFSFHLADTKASTTLRAMSQQPTGKNTPGLHAMECMCVMGLGSPILSASRFQLRRLAVFAAWEDEGAINSFLQRSELGQSMNNGWHVRMEFLRRWGYVSEFAGLPEVAHTVPENTPVAAVTLARMKIPQALRFIKWGRPVEKLVRDHPGTTMALAAMRPLRTVSTFSMWRSQREMLDMVRGHSNVPDRARHSRAMVERERKDFHHEFTTLRFRVIQEYSSVDGR
jgi:hypothetical protein